MRRPHSEWDQRPAAEKRRALREAAARLTVQHGPDGATLTNIVRASGISVAFVQQHYSGKPGLTADVCSCQMDHLLGALEEHGIDALPPPGRLGGLARALLRAAYAMPDEHRVLLMCLLIRPDPARADLHTRARWLHAAAAEALEARLPALRAQPDRAAEAASDLLLLLAARALGPPLDDAAADAQADRVMAGVLAGLREFDKAARPRRAAA